jgi:hypothetical protein
MGVHPKEEIEVKKSKQNITNSLNSSASDSFGKFLLFFNNSVF